MKLDDIGLRLSEWFERWFPDAFAWPASPLRSSSPPRLESVIRRSGCRLVRCRILGPCCVHDADDVDHHHRLHRRDEPGNIQGHLPHGCRTAGWPDRRRIRRDAVNALVSDLVEFQPHLQRPSCSGSDASCAGIGLSRDRRSGLPGSRQRVRTRAVIFRSAHHGSTRFATAVDSPHQRHDPAEPDDWSVAERFDRCGPDSGFDGSLLLLSARFQTGSWYGRHGRQI